MSLASLEELSGLRRDFAGSGEVSAAGVLEIRLGSPAAGYRWDLRRLVILDLASPATAHAGTIFVLDAHGELSGFSVADVADVSTTGIPATFQWSRGTVVLDQGEEVQVWGYGLTPAVSIVAIGQAEEEKIR